MKWLPQKIVITNFIGEVTTMDVGKDAVVTVIIKGPYVNLTLDDVKTLDVDARSI